MRSTFTRGPTISKLALLAMVASVASPHAATAAAAAPTESVGDDRSLSASAHAGYVASSANPPTLTNDVGQSSGGAEWQLAAGIALLALGLLGLVYGLVAVLSTRRRTRPTGALAGFGHKARAVRWMQPRA